MILKRIKKVDFSSKIKLKKFFVYVFSLLIIYWPNFFFNISKNSIINLQIFLLIADLYWGFLQLIFISLFFNQCYYLIIQVKLTSKYLTKNQLSNTLIQLHHAYKSIQVIVLYLELRCIYVFHTFLILHIQY